MSRYQNIFAKGMFEIDATFCEKELQRTNQKEFEKVIKKKGNKRYVK